LRIQANAAHIPRGAVDAAGLHLPANKAVGALASEMPYWLRSILMWRVFFSSVLSLAGAFAVVAQTRSGAACCSGQSVEMKGRIARVQITPGEGTPYVEVKTGDRTAKLYLGAMRYLLVQGFNPKVGDEMTAKAYPVADGYVAASVTLAGGKTLVLRDEDGRPVWRGGGRAGGPSR
jgi:hypothetical protein